MKKCAKLVSILCAAVMMLSSVAFAADSSDEAADAPVQEGAALTYDALMQSFSAAPDQSPVYPDYYGGSYINDAGILVILVTDEKAAANHLAGLNLDGNTYTMQPCVYSYQELRAVLEQMNAYMREHSDSPIARNVVSFALNTEKNAITVKLAECTEEKIQEFRRNIYDSHSLLFEASDGSIAEFRSMEIAPEKRKAGFVTAGRFVETGGKITVGLSVKIAGAAIHQLME